MNKLCSYQSSEKPFLCLKFLNLSGSPVNLRRPERDICALLFFLKSLLPDFSLCGEPLEGEEEETTADVWVTQPLQGRYRFHEFVLFQRRRGVHIFLKSPNTC